MELQNVEMIVNKNQNNKDNKTSDQKNQLQGTAT